MDEFVAPHMLCTMHFFANRPLSRIFHVVEIKDGDLDLRFQFGFPNQDYPAVMKWPELVLDLDAYTSAAHELAEAPKFLAAGHSLIQEMFEASITDKLRRKMNE